MITLCLTVAPRSIRTPGPMTELTTSPATSLPGDSQTRSSSAVRCTMAGERTRIGLWRPQVGLVGGRGGVHVHFAMHIAEDDYDSAVTLLRDRGQDVEEIAFDGAGRAAYVTDPDGNVVELWTWDVAEHLR